MRIIITTLLLIPWLVSAQTTATSIDATVPDHGQGSPVKINISTDQTDEFEQRYGVHSSSDVVYSEISLLVLEFLSLWLLFLLISEVVKLSTHKSESNVKLVTNNKIK
jgi:hypothetical protein